jgi:hypothetical protein
LCSSVADASQTTAFEAGDEGSIPFTRSDARLGIFRRPLAQGPYGPEAAAQTATSGLLAGLGTTPHEAEFSVKNLAARRVGPQ